MMQITDRLENIQDRLACGNCIIRGELMEQRTGRLSSRWSITQHVHAATRLAASWRMHACIEVIEAAAPIRPRFHRGRPAGARRDAMSDDRRRRGLSMQFWVVTTVPGARVMGMPLQMRRTSLSCTLCARLHCSRSPYVQIAAMQQPMRAADASSGPASCRTELLSSLCGVRRGSV
jgi:hypothetical protein